MNSLPQSAAFNFRDGEKLFGARNTVPDFVSDDIFNGKKVVGGSIYEVKAKNGGLYLSSNNWQLRGHIDNIVSHHIGNPLFKPSVHLITTANTRISMGNKAYSVLARVNYYHKSSYYRIVKGSYKFTFR